ncbi:MAG: DUF883 family protein [Granulosicoccus sp.]|nr:DUF883 family protein [Granulosicoccus sp.]
MPTTVTKPEQMKKVANDAIDTAEEKAHETLESARGAANKTVDKVHQLETEINDSVTALSGTVSRYVNEKPLQAAGIAFAAGVLTTLILRKR